jgi:hypothetical protein
MSGGVSSRGAIMKNLQLIAGSVTLLVFRGILLWVVVPLALLGWPICLLVQLLRRRRPPSPRFCVRWADSALVAVLGNTILRWAFDPVAWPGTDGFSTELGGRPFRDLP